MNDSTYTFKFNPDDSITIAVETRTTEARVAIWMDGYSQSKADKNVSCFNMPTGERLCAKVFKAGEDTKMFEWLAQGDKLAIAAHGEPAYYDPKEVVTRKKEFVKYYIDSEIGKLTYKQLADGIKNRLNSKVSETNRLKISACWVDENLEAKEIEWYKILVPAPGVTGVENVDEKAFEAVGASRK